MKRRRRSPLALLLLPLLLACGGPAGDGGASGDRPPPAPPGTVKIGVVTGTVSQGEDELRAAEAIERKYGRDRVVHVTYPDDFATEQDTTISQIVGLAQDPAVRVIVIGQAVPGTLRAIQSIREFRSDVLFGLIEPHETPSMVSPAADFAIAPDQEARGRTIVTKAKEIGAKTLVHYSFSRHMSMELLALRRKIMEEECKKQGIRFVFASAPDPTGEGGPPAAQQFILQDVPRQVAAHGKDTAVISTNCSMQEALIQATLDTGAMFVEPCCPGPTHGFPAALGIEIPPEKAGDFGFVNEQNAKAIAERGMSGRFVTWPVPANYATIIAAADLLVASVEGRADHRNPDDVKRYIEAAAGASVTLRKYDEAGNFWLMLVEQIVY